MASERLQRLLRPPIEREVRDELEFHLAMRTRELVERGIDPQAARLAAESRFGDLARTARECRRIAAGRDRDEHRREYWAEARQDLGFTLRQMARSPGFTAVAVLTLALGIAATTSIFSVFHAVVLQRLPLPGADRVQVVATTWRGSPSATSAGNFTYLCEHQRSFAPLAAVDFKRFNLSGGASPERLLGAMVTHDYFAVFGLAPELGRTFTLEEDAPGSDRVVVLGHGLWSRSFGSDPGVLGRRVELSGVSREVIGVMPQALDEVADGAELWVPIAFTAERRALFDGHYLDLYGRLRPGVTLARARRDLDRVSRNLARDHPREDAERGATAWPLLDEVVGAYRQRLAVLLGAVSLVLLIACANVANLLLGRGTSREREFAMRAALGAGRGRIVRQLLTESALLGGTAAGVGVLLAVGGLRVLLATAPPGVPRLGAARIDAWALGFAVAVGLLCSLVFGLAPALRASRLDLRPGLGGGRTMAGSASRDRLRRLLVSAEVALALTLLAGAGLLVRTGLNLVHARLGFEPEGLLTARVGFPREGYASHEKTARAFEAVLEHLRASPRVTGAAFVSKLPLTRGVNTNGLIPEGRPLDPRESINTDLQIVTPGYFETMRIPLIRGRYLTANDRRGAPKVMLVNQELARQAFAGEDPIGRRISCCEDGPGGPDTPAWKEVVGVVADVRPSSPGAPAPPQFYLPYDQVPPDAWDWISRTMALVVRGTDPPATLVPLVREAVRAVDPSVPVYDVETMLERRSATMAQERFGAALLSALGLVGLVLAGVGIYGVVAWFVSQSTREIAVRIALGASPGNVAALVLKKAMGPVVLGLLLGTGGAIAAGRALRAILFGVGPADPPTLAAFVLALLLTGALACLLPARRAARVDPARALADA